jgi:hypothetical protein
MNPEDQPVEILPNEIILVPFLRQHGQEAPSPDVLDANQRASRAITEAKDRFVGDCLLHALPREIQGELELEHMNNPDALSAAVLRAVDPSRIIVTKLRTYSPPIAIPQPDGTSMSHRRQTGDVITFFYGQEQIGVFTIDYQSNGQIGISASIRETAD